MSKYIDVDELKRNRYIFEEVTNPFTNKKCKNVVGERRYLTYAEIDEMPSADVVEIIRCEKCEHRINDEESAFNNCCLIHRDSHGFPMEKGPDDFCSYGERKETG